MILRGSGGVVGRRFFPVDGAPREHGSSMAQLPGARPRLREHLVAEGQQVLGDPRRGIDQERQQVDLGVPEIMPFIGLSGEAFRRHAGVFRPRRGLQDVKEVEADRLLDLHGGALGAVFPDIPDLDIAAAPEIVHVLLLGGEQLLEPLVHHAIHGPLSTAAELFRRSRLRRVIDHVFGEVDRTAGLGPRW